jgi:hypothetical protein
MADILSFNLTQTQTDVGGFKPRQMVRMNVPAHRARLMHSTRDVEQPGSVDEAEADGR